MSAAITAYATASASLWLSARRRRARRGSPRAGMLGNAWLLSTGEVARAAAARQRVPPPASERRGEDAVRPDSKCSGAFLFHEAFEEAAVFRCVANAADREA